MIAAAYGRGNSSSVQSTFTYTNAVPQAAAFNSGPWRVAEDNLVKTWASGCQDNAEQNGVEAKIFIVVGSIPSTFFGAPRFFGASGFSNFEGASTLNPGNSEYRIVFPYIMWTAACCTYTADQDTHITTTAFWRYNNPSKDMVSHHASALEMFNAIQQSIKKTWPKVVLDPINVFPDENSCMSG